MASCTKFTFRQYECHLSKWFDYCKIRSVNFSNPEITDVLSFLAGLFKKGSCSCYSAINSCRSALSFLLPTIEGYWFGSQPIVSRLIKGIGKIRPPRPKYEETWDVSNVLNFLNDLPDNDELSCTHLSVKCACLLALVTGHRVHTLSLI
jgi:hypothetical protein